MLPRHPLNYEPGPATLLVLTSRPASPWGLAVVAVLAVAIGWPWSLYALPFAAVFGFLWLSAPRWKPLDQPATFAIERDRLVLIHQGFRLAPRRTTIPFGEVEVVWDAGTCIVAELRSGRTCSIGFVAKGRRDDHPHAVYRVVENRTGLELGQHEPGAIRPWVEGVLQLLAQQGVVTRAFPPNWRMHFWGGIARRG